MEVYRSQEELERILSRLWERIFADPQITKAVADAKLVAKFRYTDFPSVLFIDLKKAPPGFYWNPNPEPDFDVEMILSSETSHAFWMETLNVPLSIARRKIIPKGSVQKALKLIPALKPAFAMYPQVLRAQGREDLLTKATKRSRKRRFFLFKRKSGWREDRLPVFPAALSDVLPTGVMLTPERKAPSDALDQLRCMHTIRYFETHLAEAFARGDLPTEAIHLSIGQEAVAAGVCMNLRTTDYLNTTHRGHGHIIAKGANLKRMMAEIYGKADGLCAGKGGSMHVTDGRRGVLGANGIVGAGFLLAMGAGFAIRYRQTDDVSVVIAGDGSVNQGMFHEALNMMAVFKLPVLVAIENNLYGEFTAIDRHSAVTEIYKRAESYGMQSCRVDGNDVIAVTREVNAAIAGIRKDGRPRLIELMTYRWHGHMEGEPEHYRSEAEKAAYQRQDPILMLEAALVDDGQLTSQAAEEVRQQSRQLVAEAVAFARSASTPDANHLLAQVYAPEPAALRQGHIGDPEDTSGMQEMSVSQAINTAIAEEMERDATVFLWGEDVTLGGYFSVSEGLVARFGPDRIIDTPISENGIVGGAVGAALTGLRPICEILFADFLSCCMDPILNQAAKLRYMTGGQVCVPLVIRSPLGSGIGMAAQHSQSMERFFFGIPGLMVVAPSDPYTAKGLLKSAIRSPNPVLFLEHKLLYANAGRVPREDYLLPLGKARVVRNGDDVTLVTHLLGVGVATDVAERLAQSGIDIEVIDLCSLYPLDTRTILDSLEKTGRLVTVEEGSTTGGIGAEVIARVAVAGFHLLKRPPLRIAAPEVPVPYAKNLETMLLPDPGAIAEQIEKELIR